MSKTPYEDICSVCMVIDALATQKRSKSEARAKQERSKSEARAKQKRSKGHQPIRPDIKYPLRHLNLYRQTMTHRHLFWVIRQNESRSVYLNTFAKYTLVFFLI